jgi:hypothetical protein
MIRTQSRFTLPHKIFLWQTFSVWVLAGLGMPCRVGLSCCPTSPHPPTPLSRRAGRGGTDPHPGLGDTLTPTILPMNPHPNRHPLRGYPALCVGRGALLVGGGFFEWGVLAGRMTRLARVWGELGELGELGDLFRDWGRGILHVHRRPGTILAPMLALTLCDERPSRQLLPWGQGEGDLLRGWAAVAGAD